MKSLWIDTSTKYLTLIFVENSQIESFTIDDCERMHSEVTLPRIIEILSNIKWNKQDIEHIYFGIGPGSYSGIRIAQTIAQMFALVNNTTLFSFSSLEFFQLIHKQEFCFKAGKNLVFKRVDAMDCLLPQENRDRIFELLNLDMPEGNDLKYAIENVQFSLFNVGEDVNYVREAIG